MRSTSEPPSSPRGILSRLRKMQNGMPASRSRRNTCSRRLRNSRSIASDAESAAAAGGGWMATSVMFGNLVQARAATSRRLPRPPVPVLEHLSEDVVERLGYVPVRIVGPGLSQVADVADVVAFSVLVDVLPLHLVAAHGFGALERLQDRATVSAPAAEVVDLSG